MSAKQPVRLGDEALRPGSRVEVTLVTSEKVEGFVHTKDVSMGLLMVREPLAHTTLSSQLRVINAAHARSIVLDPDGAEPETVVRPPTVKTLEKRELAALRRSEELMAELNDDASPHGQMVFDALNKTMPCRWDGMAIVVLDQVRIVPEYRSVDCTSLNGDEAAKDRIIKVLEGETRKMQRKLAQQQNGNGAAAQPPSPSGAEQS